MVYMGSKSRFANQIVHEIHKARDMFGINRFYDLFCGGCSIIENVDMPIRIGNDINNYVIALIEKIRADGAESLPTTLSRELWEDIRSNKDYKDIEVISKSIVYLDPPYKNTVGYIEDSFDHRSFDKYAIELAKNNIVFISEYYMGTKFRQVLELGESGNLMNSSGGKSTGNIENLWVVKNGYKIHELYDDNTSYDFIKDIV